MEAEEDRKEDSSLPMNEQNYRQAKDDDQGE